MSNILSRFVILAIALSLSLPATAQQRVRSGSLRLAGFSASCGPVPTDIMHFGDIAASSGNRIIINPRLFTMPRAQQMFWYTHECGHQILGPSEPDADCWSIQQGRQQGWLNAEELGVLEALVHRLPGDATHVSGPVRAAHMRQCYGS